MERKIRILTVDDHPLLRSGIAAVLAAEADMEVVGEAGSGEEAIERFQSLQPDITLMDVQMPGMNGIDAMIAIREKSPSANFVVLTTYTGDAQALRALKAGAMGYVLKQMLRNELVAAIRAVHHGKKHIPIEVAAELAEHVADDGLTQREIEVLRKVAAGQSNKIIGYELGVSEATVKSHLKSVLSKLNANDRTHAVTIAMRRGFLDA